MFPYSRRRNNNRPTLAYLYNPQNQSKDELISSFIVRQRIFQKLYEEIKSSKMEHPEQHILIKGKRGMGKTTLLLRLSYEIENDRQLQKWLIPLVFNEEEYSIRKVYKLWERIAEMLEEKAGEFSGLLEEFKHLSQSLSADNEYEKACFELLSDQLQKHEKKIILFIDNSTDMFEKFKDKEAHRLRKILQTSADLRIIASSSVDVRSFYDYQHPFYQFFQVKYLEELDADSTIELLLKLGQFYQRDNVRQIVKTQRGRIEAMRRLTGGVTRTIILLFEMFFNEDGDAFRDLETVLDRVTPLYKHRMDDLPAPQQEIVEAIALNWDAISVKEIGERTRMESKVISAHLSQLVKNDMVHKMRTNIKNNLYQISERFFNIWYLMRHGRRHDRNKVIWLVRFLEEWCDEVEISERAKMHISYLQKGVYEPQAAYLMTEALAFTRHLPQDLQHELLEKTRHFLEERDQRLSQQLQKSDRELYAKGQTAYQREDYTTALASFLQMKEPDLIRIAYCYEAGPEDFEQAERYYQLAVEQGEPRAHYFLGYFYQNKLKKFRPAETQYKKAIKLGNVDAAFALATLYLGKKRFAKAQQYFQMAAEKDHFDAQLLLACTYLTVNKQIETAEELFLNIFQRSVISDPDFRYTTERLKLMSLGLIFLLSREQFDFVYDFFQRKAGQKLSFRDRFKPIYYTLLYFLQDKYPNQYLRMGEELKETVEEIIAQVQQMQGQFFCI